MASSGLLPLNLTKESNEFQYKKIENNTFIWKGGLHRILSMQGGETEDSYVNNSKVQELVCALSKPFLVQAIQSTKVFRGETSIRMADLGCATGYNTLDTVELVVETLRQHYTTEELDGGMPELEVFFVDLPSNDFNLLFQLLPELYDDERRYYAAGVPGSFYHRLFPKGKLHIAVSLSALQWLSQIPEAVLEKRSSAWNSGRVWVDGARKEVGEAYAKQSQDDLVSFLQCRREELVEGGMLFLLMGGRPSSAPPENQIGDPDTRATHPLTIFMEQAWEDLLTEGLIDEEKRDTFNFPIYMRSTNEVKKAFDQCTGFEIKLVEYHRIEEHLKENPVSYGRAKTNFTRAGVKAIVETHLGPKLCEELFKRYEKRVSTATDTYHKTCFYGIIIVFAIRK